MKALVLAGGFPQIALIKELKSRGIEVLLSDYNAEPIAKPYADRYFRVSTLDVEAITKIAKDEKVDFLITACTDQALLTVAKVSKDLGLPCYIDYDTALNVTNKAYMKKVFCEYAVPTAKHVITSSYNKNLSNGMDWPLIVKPVDCNSSKGVKKVDTEQALEKAVEIATKLSRTGTAVVEEFVEGEELSADVYVENGKAKLLSVSGLDKIKDNDKFIIFRGRYSPLPEDVCKMIEDTADKIAKAFGLYDSPMLIQMIYDGKKIKVLEFSARTGGGVKYLLIKKTSGFDVIKAVVDLTLGVKPVCEKKQPESKYIYNEFIYCKPGVFDKLDGFEQAKQQGVISDYYLFKWKGAIFDKIESSGDRVAGFTVQGNDLDDVKEKHHKANAMLKVLDELGNDMMRHDLFDEV